MNKAYIILIFMRLKQCNLMNKINKKSFKDKENKKF